MDPPHGLVECLRLVKDAGEEQEAMRAAGRIADQTFQHILRYIKPGVRENELAAEMEHFMRRQGADGPSFETIVASGWRSALPHGVASSKRVEKGDMIVFDFGCLLEGYCSDMTRMVCVGSPRRSREDLRHRPTCPEAAGFGHRPGRTAGDVDAAARGVIREAGYGAHFGHGRAMAWAWKCTRSPAWAPRAPES